MTEKPDGNRFATREEEMRVQIDLFLEAFEAHVQANHLKPGDPFELVLGMTKYKGTVPPKRTQPWL